MKETVFFLGSGATKGSGIKKNNETLPTDSEFFESTIVKKYIENYPALKMFIESKYLKYTKGLCKVWEDIFIYRGLAVAGIIQDKNIDKKINGLRNETVENQHYKCQFEIIDYEIQLFSPQQKPKEYYLAELAIWDLRVLLKEVYDNYDTDNEIYSKFYKLIEHTNSIFVNLNYDTTFDDCLSKHQPKIKIIRPHGSLKWTSKSLFSTESNNWGWSSWNEYRENIDLKKLGYKGTGKNRILEFHQPLIVPPIFFKEEIVGNSSMIGLQNEILKIEWDKLSEALKNSQNWVFIGLSFASGDEHIIALMKHLYSEEKHIHCSSYGNESKGREALERLNKIFEKAICQHTHHIEENKTIDTFPLCESLESGDK